MKYLILITFLILIGCKKKEDMCFVYPNEIITNIGDGWMEGIATGPGKWIPCSKVSPYIHVDLEYYKKFKKNKSRKKVHQRMVEESREIFPLPNSISPGMIQQ